MADRPFRQPSVMTAQQHFSQVPSADVPRSKFDRSHAHKTTFDAGKLIPVFIDEVMPGDTHTMSVTQFSRLATPLHPIMDNIYMDTHFWFVPMRLVWEHWVNFMGERDDPDDNPDDYSVPQTSVILNAVEPSSMYSYLGIPKRAGAVSPIQISALYTRAIALIWNEWYRDQNLQPRVAFSKDDGPDNTSAYLLNGSCLPRGKRKDYFTGALPWPQKGDPVYIPLGDSAPVVANSNIAASITTSDPGSSLYVGGTLGAAPGHIFTPSGLPSGDTTTVLRGYIYQSQFNDADVVADLTQATAVSINDLRTAVQVQRLLERDARGGTRYIELIFSHFRVKSDDARLQRPEYLGGGSQHVVVNPIAATATAEGVPQGNLAAIGTVIAKAGFQKSFTEHGIIVGLVSARADLTYQQGIHRHWFNQHRYDFPWPAFAHLGEQPILMREIYATGDDNQDLDVFAYQERYAEYRYKPSYITGLMSSEQSGSLDVWHLSQDFESAPAFNASFIVENPPIDRVIAVPSEPHFIADFWFDYKSDRPLPVYSEPGLMDHY